MQSAQKLCSRGGVSVWLFETSPSVLKTCDNTQSAPWLRGYFKSQVCKKGGRFSSKEFAWILLWWLGRRGVFCPKWDAQHRKGWSRGKVLGVLSLLPFVFSIKMTCQVLKHTVSDDVRLGSGENRRIYFCAHFFNFHSLSSFVTNAMRCHEYSRGLMCRHWSNPCVWCYSKALFK